MDTNFHLKLNHNILKVEQRRIILFYSECKVLVNYAVIFISTLPEKFESFDRKQKLKIRIIGLEAKTQNLTTCKDIITFYKSLL